MKKMCMTIVLVICMLAASCSSGETTVESGKLPEVLEAVKAAYGENYIPSMELDETYLSEVMGMPAEDIKDFVAEGPMMNVPKLKATQILRVDQYVFYVCLGAYDEDSLDETAAEQYYKEQVEIGIKAIHDTLGK